MWNTFKRVIKKRHRSVAFFFAGAVLASGVILSVYQPKPQVYLPVLVSDGHLMPPNHSYAPQDFATKIRVNPCADLHSYVCSLRVGEDPTGVVKPSSEGEVEALRILESIVRNSKRPVSGRELDEQLANRIYTNEKVNRLRALFEKVKAASVAFIDAQPFEAISESERKILRERIQQVALELPPPAAIYVDDPKLLTSSEVYYERTAAGRLRVRIGGALLFTVDSTFNLAFTLGHEIAHAIDPCELKVFGLNLLSYEGITKCFKTPTSDIKAECSIHGRLSEMFADWMATHIVVELLQEVEKSFTPRQQKTAVFASVRDLCADDGENTEQSPDLASAHPPNHYRVNQIFAQHPNIRKILGCKDLVGPTLPGLPSYCFWSPK